MPSAIEPRFVDVLARLLTDRSARDAFLADRGAFLSAHPLGAEDHDALLSLDAEGLLAQARTLLTKRRHEAAPLMPLTWQNLDADGWELFLDYAEHEWPAEDNRQVADAARFSRFLARRGDPRVDLSELHLLEFLARERRWSCRVLPMTRDGRTRGFTLELRFRRRDRSANAASIYLGL